MITRHIANAKRTYLIAAGLAALAACAVAYVDTVALADTHSHNTTTFMSQYVQSVDEPDAARLLAEIQEYQDVVETQRLVLMQHDAVAP